MPDAFDQASEIEEIERARCIAHARRQAPGLPYRGTCYFCTSPVPEPERFCDGDCAADHERERAAKIRNGWRD